MNPILATNLVSLGKEVFDRFTAAPKKFEAKSNATFANELQIAETTISKKPIEDLEKKFLNHEDIKEFLSTEIGNQVHLEKRADGSMQLISASGRTLLLSNNGESCRLGSELFSASIDKGVNLSAHRANAILIQR